MKQHERQWKPAGFFHLRTPLLPFDDLVAFGRDLGSHDREVLRTRLRAWAQDDVVREAIYVASPELHHELERWLADGTLQDNERLEVTLYNYLARMCGRATPFGLFAGVTTGTTGATSAIELAERGAYRRASEPDSAALLATARAIAAKLDGDAPVRQNHTLYRAGSRVRYIASSARGFTLESLVPDAPLEAALSCAREAAVSIHSIATVVAAACDVTEPVARRYVDALVRRGVFVSDIEPALTSARALDDLMERVAANPSVDDAHTTLLDLRTQLTALDASELGGGGKSFEHMTPLLSPAAQGGVRFQVDLTKPARTAAVSSVVTHEILAGTLVLQRLFRQRRHRAFEEFRRRFVERYEEREVPLCEALDEDTGIGFGETGGPESDPSPLLDGLSFPSQRSASPFSVVARWLMPRVVEALRTHRGELVISLADIEQWEREEHLPAPDRLPDAFTALVVVAAASPNAVDAGDFRVLHSGAGTQGASMLGRFCQRDPALHAHVERYLRAEEALRPDAVFAEVVYRPNDRLANVTQRPVLREYEIPLVGKSGADPQHQIALTDLGVSVLNGRVRLRSVRLDREVLPRFSTALDVNHPMNFALMRFLTVLQMQEGVGVKFSWGALESLPVLPRVVCGRTILARAQWRIDDELRRGLRAARGSERFRIVDAFRRRTDAPRFVGVESGADGAMPIDLENPLAIDALARAAESASVLTEVFPLPEEMIVRGPEGVFTHEMVVPFIRTAGTGESSPPIRTDTRAVAPLVRTVVPGGEWLYLRVFCGRATADVVLVERVVPVIRAAMESGACTEWFFIRYNDPEPHLRIRLRGDATRLARDVVPMLHEIIRQLVDEGLVSRVQYDTYEREIERFGGAASLHLAEAVFCADSDATVEILQSNPHATDRWKHALLGMHHLYVDFAVPAEMDALLETERQFGLELGADSTLRTAIGERWRRERESLAVLLAGDAPEWIARRSRRLAPIAVQLQSAISSGECRVPMERLVRAFAHLHVNRMLRSSWREQEFVLTGLLARALRAERERKPAQ